MKGMTLLNSCEINTQYLEFVTEVSVKNKQILSGTDLKILEDKALVEKELITH